MNCQISSNYKKKLIQTLNIFISVLLVVPGHILLNPTVAKAALGDPLPFSDSFGSPNSTVDGWEENETAAQAEAKITADNPRPGSPTSGNLHLRKNAAVIKTLDTADYENIQLSFYWRGDEGAEASGGSADYLIGSWRVGEAGEWNEIFNKNLNCAGDANFNLASLNRLLSIATQLDCNWSPKIEINLPASADNTTIQIKFVGDTSANDEYARIDDVSVTGEAIIVEPICGNELIENGEQCDDGNTEDSDDCSAQCQLENNLQCEDLKYHEFELCLGKLAENECAKYDFSENTVVDLPDLGIITTECGDIDRQHLCGDYYYEDFSACLGQVVEPGDDCEFYDLNENTVIDLPDLGQILQICSENNPSCGDGEINQESEQCDDGNTENGDDCSAQCLIEEDEPTTEFGSIHGLKWNDINGNGRRDENENGLADWLIELRNSDGELVATSTTCGGAIACAVGESSVPLGTYWFENIQTPAKYSVTEILLAGWEQTYPASCESLDYDESGNINNDDLPHLFELENNLLACLGELATGDCAAYDYNGNTAIDLPDLSILLKKFSLFDFCNNKLSSAQSGYLLELSSGQNLQSIDFGNHELEDEKTNICGVKWNDHNQNGEQDENEENLPDWDITLQAKLACEENDDWADLVVSFNQGKRADDSSVVPERSDASKALNAAQNNDTNNFVSLGYGGELILEFDNLIENGVGNDVKIYETSFNSPTCDAYPEKIRVYASNDGNNWVDLGSACQENNPEFDLGSLSWAKYLKLIDESDKAQFNGTSDGFDIDGVKALHCLKLSETTLETTTTENGYCFNALEPGYYLVSETLQAGWTNSTPLQQQVWVNSTTTTYVTFGNYQIDQEEETNTCADEDDNDQDELTDNDDPACHTDGNPNNESSYDGDLDESAGGTCSDGLNNDADSLIDAADPDCQDEGGYNPTGYEENDDSEEPETPPIIPSAPTGGSGGGGGGLTGLYLHTEQTDQPTTVSVTITWHTNLPATSRVLYDTVSHEPITGPGPNYGYASSTLENPNKTTFHSVVVEGLTPKTTYYFRPISAASPEKLGKEISKTTSNLNGNEPTVGEDTTPSEQTSSNNSGSNTPNNDNADNATDSEEPIVLGLVTNNAGDTTATTDESTSTEEIIFSPDETDNDLAATEGKTTGRTFPWWLIIFIIALYLLFLFWRKRQEKEEEEKNKN